jgi:hypothetical protein
VAAKRPNEELRTKNLFNPPPCANFFNPPHPSSIPNSSFRIPHCRKAAKKASEHPPLSAFKFQLSGFQHFRFPLSAFSSMPFRIAALLTCHNRREKTVECLRALRVQTLPGWNGPPTAEEDRRLKIVDSPNSNNAAHLPSPISDLPSPNRYAIEVFLVDDGSTDGTADAVREVWPEATIIQGDGNLFWCGGMRVAWAAAAKTDPD